MASTLNKFLLAFMTLAVLAIHAAAQSPPCYIWQCSECAAGNATQCAICNPGYRLNAMGQCVTNVNASAAPDSAVTAITAVAAVVAVAVAYMS
ncbi:surface antigen-like protein [Leishmania tarentolae]|uniref:Surface antigen-like protein n=1 Tax=Leishmania tarentolae TaxID=5689 RepID=A0A640KB29_LEITA|nr:surface antigen-like protein [Leishmania tarentolae]